MPTNKVFIIFATISGGIAVIFGAFGAHALKSTLLENSLLEAYKTAVEYQFYHTLALLVLGFRDNSKLVQIACYGFVLGIIFFSGSLYTMCLTNVKWIGAITPLGGLLFISGWALLGVGLWREFNSSRAAEYW